MKATRNVNSALQLDLVGRAELRIAAGQRILTNPRLGAVQLVDPRIGKPVLVTREEIRVGDAVLAAAREHGIDPAGRSTEDLVDVVLAAVEASCSGSCHRGNVGVAIRLT